MVTKMLTVLVLESHDQLFKFSSICFSDSSKFSAMNSCYYYNWKRNFGGFKYAQQSKERGKNRGLGSEECNLGARYSRHHPT